MYLIGAFKVLHLMFYLFCYVTTEGSMKEWTSITSSLKNGNNIKCSCVVYSCIDCVLETRNDKRNSSELNVIGVQRCSYLYLVSMNTVEFVSCCYY